MFRKYLRDAERLVLADEAFVKCLSVVDDQMDDCVSWSEVKREENLLTVYRVFLAGRASRYNEAVTNSLHRAFRIMMKGRVGGNERIN